MDAPDRERVIESLNKALTRVGNGDMDNVTLSEVEEAIESAITLLREQETHLVHHYSRPGVYADLWLYCEVCGGKVDGNSYPKFCPNCGRKVKERE